MKTRFFIICLVFLLAAFCLLNVSAAAYNVVDEAGLLTDKEESALAKKLEDFKNEHGVELAVVLVNTTNGQDIERFSEIYYKTAGFDYDGIMLLVNMNTDGAAPEGKALHLYSSGVGYDALSDAQSQHICDSVAACFADKDYTDGVSSFVSLCDARVGEHKNGKPFNWFLSLAVSLGIGLVVALISTGVMRSKLKSVHKQTTATQYVDRRGVNLEESRDLFLYSNVVKTYIPRSNPSGRSGSSRGGGGRSGGTTSRF